VPAVQGQYQIIGGTHIRLSGRKGWGARSPAKGEAVWFLFVTQAVDGDAVDSQPFGHFGHRQKPGVVA
jgi:hypothetical protein